MTALRRRWPGLTPYEQTFSAMRVFTADRLPEAADELWVVEHAPVYTLGQAGRREHLLAPGDIPVVESNRGGQVTYHGPGQVVVYVLWDLHRAGLTIRGFVERLEEAVIDTLAEHGVSGACRKPGAPGVYVPWGETGELAKISALGVKVSRGCSYHGVALNVAMDTTPFLGINPCGYAGLRTVDMQACGATALFDSVADTLCRQLEFRLAAGVSRV